MGNASDRTTVVVLDDERDILDELEGVFDKDFNFHSFDWPDEFLRFFSKPKKTLVGPVFVFLDVRISYSDEGFEVLRKLRKKKQSPYLFVIMASSSDDEHDVQKAYKLGANLYVNKRYDFAERAKEIVDFLGKNALLPKQKGR